MNKDNIKIFPFATPINGLKYQGYLFYTSQREALTGEGLQWT